MQVKRSNLLIDLGHMQNAVAAQKELVDRFMKLCLMKEQKILPGKLQKFVLKKIKQNEKNFG